MPIVVVCHRCLRPVPPIETETFTDGIIWCHGCVSDTAAGNGAPTYAELSMMYHAVVEKLQESQEHNGYLSRGNDELLEALEKMRELTEPWFREPVERD